MNRKHQRGIIKKKKDILTNQSSKNMIGIKYKHVNKRTGLEHRQTWSNGTKPLKVIFCSL